MLKKLFIAFLFTLTGQWVLGQSVQPNGADGIPSIVLDSVIHIRAHKLDVQYFIDAVTNDTSFYKAFQDIKKHAFTADNSMYEYDNNNKARVSLYRKIIHTTQPKSALNYTNQTDSGNIFKNNREYRLYTFTLFDYLFLSGYQTKSAISTHKADSKNQSYKSKLKTLLFRPGTKIKGLPFISDKTEIFSPELKQFYTYEFARGTYMDSIPVYRFKVARKYSTAPGDVIINEMTTIFDARTLQILGRYVDMSTKNLLFSFDVKMNMELTRFNGELLPAKVSYYGNWHVPFHKRERAGVIIRYHY